ncbi:MAG: apolipoprotein N-acyltransferase [Chthoniobacterales bacterium]|nr:apolipoprotein N-acyltransferase [Chthoniobacterales bacterium]
MDWVKKALRCWPWLAAIASGALYRACFAPYGQGWLCWVALTPLLAAVWFSGEHAKRRWLRDLLLGYVAGVVFFGSVFSWLVTVTVPGAVLVGLYMAVYMALWGWLAGRLRPGGLRPVAVKGPTGIDAVTQRLAQKQAAGSGGLPSGGREAPLPVPVTSPWLSSSRNLLLAFLLASAWVALETVRSHLFSGWGWNMLGSALHAQWAMIQIVDMTGVAGLSFLTAWTNVILVATVRRFMLETQVRKVRPHFDLTLTMAALVGVMGYGIRAVQVRQPSSTVRIAALQPNIPREQKFSAEHAQSTFDKFAELSRVALQSRPDLLLWPESSMPHVVLPGTDSYDFVMQFSSEIKTDLLLGVIDEDDQDAYNAAILVAGGDQQIQLYRKLHLVPFGEYVPGRHTLPGIGAIVGDQVPEDFGFGKEFTVLKTSRPDVRLAPLICFEDTIGELTRQFVRRGANLLTNVTNDGWFLRSAGSQQHLDNAVFRCVENRLPMVRSANTGITCFINEFGRITQILLDETGSQFTEGVLTGEISVPTDPTPTFYVRHGELFAHICTGIGVLTLLALLPRLVRRQGAPRA